MNSQTPSTELDFLSLALDGRGVLDRRGGIFTMEAPWAVADFGRHRLARGWWRLDVEGDAPLTGLELRLSSIQEPLLCIRGTGALGERFRIGSGDPIRVSLLLSPWPGTARFNRLVFRRLSAAEAFGLYGRALVRFSRQGQWFPRLWSVARRVMAGRAVGLRVAGRPPFQRDDHKASVLPGAASEREIVVRDGDLCVVLREGDVLHPRAFALVRTEFARRPGALALFADAWEGEQLVPAPEWDPVLAQHWLFPAPPVFVKVAAIPSGASPRDEIRKLRVQPGAIGRVPLPLVRRAASLAEVIAQPPAPRLEHPPTVSIVIPTKTRIDLLDACLRSLAECTDYSRFDVVVVNNGSTDPRLPEVLKRWGNKLNLAEIVDDAPFNFSRLVNAGVRRSKGEIAVLLNDDIEAIDPSWLTRMVASAMAPETGIVGVRLLYPDRTIQHAGVVCGIAGVCGHQWKGLSPEQASRNPYVMLPGERAAVTGACIAIRREVFDKLGGLDAEAFPVAFNDIDICLRARRAGYRNIYRGDAALIHHESQSRGDDAATVERQRRLRREMTLFLERWEDVLDRDPHASPAFDPMHEDGRWHPALDDDW